MLAVEFHLEKSPAFTGLLGAMYLGSLVAVFILEIPILYKIFLMGFLVNVFHKNCRQHASRKSPCAITKVWQDSKSRWGFETVQGLRYRAVLLSDSYHSRFLTILRLKTLSKTFNVLIPADSLSQNSYRILRRHLVFF